MQSDDALFDRPDDKDQQWRLESILLCNWGGFDGIEEIEFGGLSTLISGVSGAGKSTVLDAWTTLMMPTAALNTASNEAGARRRGEGTRTTLTYVRGQWGFVEHCDSEVPLVLRGVDIPGPLGNDGRDTWSAIAAVFVSGTGIRHSFLRTFFAPREAVTAGDMKTQYAVFVGKLNRRHVLEYLEPAAVGHEFGKSALERLPGLTVLHPAAYGEELQRRLGIGAHGGGNKALQLLYDIQRGKPVPRVSRLFQDLVLERPVTFEKADKVIESFDGLDKMHTQMKDAEDQLAVLDGLDTDNEAMRTAIAEIERIDTLGLSRPDRSPFQFWAHQYKAQLLTEELLLVDEQYEMGTAILGELKTAADKLDAELEAARSEFHQAGGNDADVIGAELTRMRKDRDRIQDARQRFETATRPIGAAIPDSVQAFTELQQQSRRFLAGYAATLKEAKERSNKIQQAKWQLNTKIDAAEKEIERLRRAKGNIDGRLTDVRERFARASGLTNSELPFVGELLDMHDDYERWRTAADAELGGFANTLLLDERVQARFQRAINDLPDLRRRVSFRAVAVELPIDATVDQRTLAGRLVVKEGPFAGWLRRQINANYGLHCVNTAADFTSDDTPQITLTGQTKRGKRGAHGSSGRVIGFSNEARQAELFADITAWRSQREPIEQQLAEIAEAEQKLTDQHAAHTHLNLARWSDLDLTHVLREIAEREAALDRLIYEKNLDLIKTTVDRLKEEHSDAVRKHERQALAVEGVEERRLGLTGQAAELDALISDWAKDPFAVPTQEQADDLDARLGQLGDDEWRGGPDGFDNAMRTLRFRLEKDISAATARRDTAATAMINRFKLYQARPEWRSDSRGDTLADYEDYLAILDDLRDRGLWAQRRNWARAVIEWSGEDLSELLQSYRRAEDDIEERLRPIRRILATIPFGRSGERLDIDPHFRRPTPVAAFLTDLRTLAGGTMNPNASDEAVLDRFTAIRAAVARIRNGREERSILLDIRRHLTVKARAGIHVYDHLGDLSGGEGQMITAFIVGAALRYHLGDEKRNRPRFAPVVLDEAFIKADGEYTGSAVEAWKHLGFQLIVGAPEEKVNSLEAPLDLSVVVTKNPDHYSRAVAIPRKPSG